MTLLEHRVCLIMDEIEEDPAMTTAAFVGAAEGAYLDAVCSHSTNASFLSQQIPIEADKVASSLS